MSWSLALKPRATHTCVQHMSVQLTYKPLCQLLRCKHRPDRLLWICLPTFSPRSPSVSGRSNEALTGASEKP